jgi:riboflavin kinase/FMN adenylyltransferase
MSSEVFFIDNIDNIKEIKAQNVYNSAVAIGNFDGLHLGHINILNQLKQQAKKNNLKSSVVIFNPHPVVFFSNNHNFTILALEDKINKLKQLEIDNIFVLNFNNFNKLTAESFITDFLISHLNTKIIVAGNDFVFGTNKKHISQVSDFLTQNKISIVLVDNVFIEDKKISSSNIRQYLQQGNLQQSKKMLGYNFFINGVVVKGNQLGRTIGFPTANINLTNYIHPRLGIYVVKATFNNKTYNAVANFGIRPTVNEVKVPLLEVYIFDFSQDIYNNILNIEFLDFLRGEQKFNSLNELKQAIANDCLQAKEYFNKN